MGTKGAMSTLSLCRGQGSRSRSGRVIQGRGWGRRRGEEGGGGCLSCSFVSYQLPESDLASDSDCVYLFSS